MIELTNATVQTVTAGQSVVYTSTAVRGGCAERHREGSAQITLTKPGRYLVGFSGNIAIPSDGTAGGISLALTYDGEIIGGSSMRSTPAAVEEYGNVSTQHWVDVYYGSSGNIAVQNTSGVPVLVESPNITVVRVCG